MDYLIDIIKINFYYNYFHNKDKRVINKNRNKTKMDLTNSNRIGTQT